MIIVFAWLRCVTPESSRPFLCLQREAFTLTENPGQQFRIEAGLFLTPLSFSHVSLIRFHTSFQINYEHARKEHDLLALIALIVLPV